MKLASLLHAWKQIRSSKIVLNKQINAMLITKIKQASRPFYCNHKFYSPFNQIIITLRCKGLFLLQSQIAQQNACHLLNYENPMPLQQHILNSVWVVYCLYLLKIIFIFRISMKGKLAAQLETILQDLKNQNNQINCTLKSLKKVKSVEVIQPKPSKSVIDHTIAQKIQKNKAPQQIKSRKSKTFHRCTSCKIIGDASHKENVERPKESAKIISKKAKTSGIIETQRKSFIHKNKSPTRKSTVTIKYMAALQAKKTKIL